MRAIVETSRVGLSMSSDEYFSLPFSPDGTARPTVSRAVSLAVIEALEGFLGSGRNEIVTMARTEPGSIVMETVPGYVTIWLVPGLRL